MGEPISWDGRGKPQYYSSGQFLRDCGSGQPERFLGLVEITLHENILCRCMDRKLRPNPFFIVRLPVDRELRRRSRMVSCALRPEFFVRKADLWIVLSNKGENQTAFIAGVSRKLLSRCAKRLDDGHMSGNQFRTKKGRFYLPPSTPLDSATPDVLLMFRGL